MYEFLQKNLVIGGRHARTTIKYVSTGIPNWTEGENYCDSPDELRRIFEYVDPRLAPHTYCVVKPIRNFSADETPELVAFFTRPESLCGLHQLAAFVTNDQWRICFKFVDGDAYEVKIADYH